MSGSRGIAPAAALLMTPVMVTAHHSHAEFSEQIREVRGELLSVVWRNPHPALTLSVVNAGGQEEVWRIQVQGNVNGLDRDGVSGEEFRVGESVAISGRISSRRDGLLLATVARFDDGTETILGPDESTGAAIYRGSAAGADSPTGSSETDSPVGPENLFRVWTVLDRVRNAELPLTAAARAAKAAWDPLLDDPQRGCKPLGMPGAMMSPHPVEFIQRGENIILRLEEWDAVRTIHMVSGNSSATQPATPLGYSVGHWEDKTLVVTTNRIDYPQMDEHGTPQSAAVEVMERFVLNPDGRTLDWAATVTDPETFTEPVVAFSTRWQALPGEALQAYNCMELDALAE